MDDPLATVTRGLAECVTGAELATLLDRERQPTAYIGYEPSGLLHAGSLVGLLKVRELLAAGFRVTALLADWHGYLNDKLGGDWTALRAGTAYQQQLFTAFAPGVAFRTASELVREAGYWERVLRVAKATSLARMRRALAIMGRSGAEAERDTSIYFYPAMQVADIYALGVDVALGGLDQRHAHMLARDVAAKLGWRKPIALHTPLLGALAGPGRMDVDAKMSKSDPSGALLVHDDLATLQRKLRKAHCPAGERAGNPVLDLWQHLLAPALGEIVIARPAKFGGDLAYDDYATLERAFTAGELHPLDLKNGAAAALHRLCEPLRQACDADPAPYAALRAALPR